MKKEKKKKKVKMYIKAFSNVVLIICACLLFFGVIYGSFQLTKSISYSLFYKDMVNQTVIEMVKSDCLK